VTLKSKIKQDNGGLQEKAKRNRGLYSKPISVKS
jgi:hypothetical protein